MGDVIHLFSQNRLEARSTANPRLSRINPVAIHFLHTGRNAWHGTWSARYEAGDFFANSTEVRAAVDRKATQGTVFYLTIIPGFQLEFHNRKFIWTEINSSAPFSFNLIHERPWLAKNLRLNEWLAAVCGPSDFWSTKQKFSDSIIVQEVDRLFTNLYSHRCANRFMATGSNLRRNTFSIGGRFRDWEWEKSAEQPPFATRSFDRLAAKLAGEV